MIQDRYIAAEKPPHLKAIAPWEGIGDFYRESICRGGIPNYAFWDLLMQEFNGRSTPNFKILCLREQGKHLARMSRP